MITCLRGEDDAWCFHEQEGEQTAGGCGCPRPLGDMNECTPMCCKALSVAMIEDAFLRRGSRHSRVAGVGHAQSPHLGEPFREAADYVSGLSLELATEHRLMGETLRCYVRLLPEALACAAGATGTAVISWLNEQQSARRGRSDAAPGQCLLTWLEEELVVYWVIANAEADNPAERADVFQHVRMALQRRLGVSEEERQSVEMRDLTRWTRWVADAVTLRKPAEEPSEATESTETAETVVDEQ